MELKKVLITLFLVLKCFDNYIAQCPPSTSTSTITGFYSSDLNPAPGSIIYVASSATITGNINLNNSSLYNCGTILSSKIKMRQSVQNNQYILENNNIIKCDTISLDSLGHLHNNSTFTCGLLKLSYNSNFDNSYTMDINRFIVEKQSKLNSQSIIKVNYFDMQDNNSSFYNLYSTISARKLFRLGTGTVMYGIVFICADSCFINNGIINNQAMPTWTPTIRVNNLSTNTGTIDGIDFCDLTSSSGGMPDANTGILTNVTFCSSQQYYCDYSLSILKRIHISANFFIYPNPFTNKIIIELPPDFNYSNSSLEVFDNLGKQVFVSKEVEQKKEIDVEFLPTGLYYLKIKNDDEFKMFKIIKE